MRSTAEIQDRIRFLLSEELEHRIDAARARLPHNCVHNARHPLDVRKHIEGEPNAHYNRLEDRHQLPVLGLCMLGSEDPSTWPGNICEDPIDAKRCPYFTMNRSPEEIKDELTAQIKDLSWVSQNMPEVSGLLWSLGSEDLPKLPWWRAFWFWILQIRPDGLERRPKLPSGD